MTRYTVVWEVPHISAAPRQVPTSRSAEMTSIRSLALFNREISCMVAVGWLGTATVGRSRALTTRRRVGTFYWPPTGDRYRPRTSHQWLRDQTDQIAAEAVAQAAVVDAAEDAAAATFLRHYLSHKSAENLEAGRSHVQHPTAQGPRLEDPHRISGVQLRSLHQAGVASTS